jgi:hypothetical protein
VTFAVRAPPEFSGTEKGITLNPLDADCGANVGHAESLVAVIWQPAPAVQINIPEMGPGPISFGSQTGTEKSQ